MFESVLRWWCRAMHNNVLYPVHGKYICGVCLRQWPVPWAEPEKTSRVNLRPQVQPDVDSDVVVTSPNRGTLLIRLPLRYFRSAAAQAPEAVLTQKAAAR